MSKLFQALHYLNHWLLRESVHSLQAPFIFDLYSHTFANKRPRKDFSDYEKIRTRFQISSEYIEVEDFGAGSQVQQGTARRLSKIAAYGIVKKRYAEWLDKIIHYLNAREIIELGTALGITSLYLSSEKQRNLTTFEGAPALADIAESVFRECDRKNITVVRGNIDDTLPAYIDKIKKPIDFVFADANHTYEATLRYFELLLRIKHDKTCIVFDDICLTRDMKKAWEKIKAHEAVTLSANLFQLGVVFFDPRFDKQHYTLSV